MSTPPPGTDPNSWIPLFRSPALDPAPWYDAARPESADFLGLLIADTRPFSDDTTSRQATIRAGGLMGSALSPPHRDAQVWRITGTLVASNHAGLEYGRRWLAARLSVAPGCDHCGLSDVRIRSFCPPCDAHDDQEGEYLLYDAAMTSGVHVVTDTGDSFDFQDVQFEITTGNGWLYKRPQPVTSGPITGRDPCAEGDFCEWLVGVPPPVCGTIPTPGVIGTYGVIIEVWSGSGGVAGPFTIAVTSAGGAVVGSIVVGSLPPATTWIFDSAQHQTLIVDSTGMAHDGAPYLLLADQTVIPWIELSQCDPSGVQICSQVAHYCHASADASVAISLQERAA